MDEQMTNQVVDSIDRLAAAAQTLEKALERLESEREAMVTRIVAAIDERYAGEGKAEGEAGELRTRLETLERENREIKAQAAHAARKTLSPLVSGLLAKQGLDEGAVQLEASALDKALTSLSLEQRIAVKAEMARAGMIE
jgi:seryl-tRNA synthetase